MPLKLMSSSKAQYIGKFHDGKRYIIKLGKSTRYLSTYEVETQGSKRVDCHMCDEIFTCQQNLEEHKELEHG